MQEYTYTNFINTLNNAGRCVADAVHSHITGNYSEYKPFNIKPLNSTLNIWGCCPVRFCNPDAKTLKVIKKVILKRNDMK